MGFNPNQHNPFIELSNGKLADELGKLSFYGNLSEGAQLLLLAARKRLSSECAPLKAGDTGSAPTPASRVVGVDLAGVENHRLTLVNLVKELVFSSVRGKPDNACNYLVDKIIESMESLISTERLATAQVFLEIKPIDEPGEVKWRAFVDIPVVERPGEFIRHYITRHMYYAYPVQMVAMKPNFTKVPYSTVPPSWTSVEVFTDLLVNFDEQFIKHEYKRSDMQGVGVYICEMNGEIRAHHQPGTYY